MASPERARSPLAEKVLLVGWDAADWKVIHPLLDAGKMPNLERVVDGGVIGNLATISPDLSPMLWTSIATGKRPYKHGILGFTEPDPHSGGIRPITNVSRKTKAVWNILSQVGRKCIVMGWWPSHPAEPIDGVMVSNRYPRATVPADQPWPVPRGTVHPQRLVRNLAALRWHPQHLEDEHILPFVPDAARVDQDGDRRLATLARIICEACSIQDAALAVMHHEPWDFAAVYFDAIDHFCHAFMSYHPPRLEWVSERDFEIYRHVVEGGYILHDIILGKLLAEAGEQATVLLVSDHGFHSDHLRPRSVPREPAGPAVQHRHYGVFAMMGPGIKRDDRLYGASLLDVCPTVLTLFGLPVGEDMDGKALVDAFEAPPPLHSLPTWDEVPGPAGTHPANLRTDPLEAREAIQQLVALGYIEKPDEDREKAVMQTVRELDYNLARAYMDAGLHVRALPLLRELMEAWPQEHRFGVQMATCCQALGRIAEARALLEAVLARKRGEVAAAREQLEAKRGALARKSAGEPTREEMRELRDLHADASANPFAVEYLLGALLFAEGDEEGALEHLRRAARADARRPPLHLKLGDVYLRMERWEEAEQSFLRALELDPDSAEAYQGLCESYLPRRWNLRAAEAAMDSVGLRFHNPRAHFHLGVALHRLGEIDRAIQALKVAVRQNPNYPEAHRRMAYLYRRRLHNPLKAAEHGLLARQASRRIRDLRRGRLHVEENEGAPETPAARGDGRADHGRDEPSPPEAVRLEGSPAVDLSRTVTIVSGLPRSGTSMMMQMLAAGGLPSLTDGQRPADEDNPRGYLEYEKARRIRADASWLPEAQGKAVKIVPQLLLHLDPRLRYRILLMERDMEEVLASQRSMLERRGKAGADLSTDRLGKVFARQVSGVREVLSRRGVPLLRVSHAACLRTPAAEAARVNRFLGGALDEASMAAAVDPALHRHRR